MATLTFKGGVHPYDGKELSKDKSIVPYQPKGDLIYPVSQHIGLRQRRLSQKATVFWWDRRLRKQEDLYPHRSTRRYLVP